ncbi:hypothetical protein AB0M20_03005 [Actinoplanes sp. NPDC051633]|uniref:fascin domain-containing protein n=1 Tax=Actinoplanes sp. NPDC051633 TaxID=3155670 RepID=UPI003434C67D
MKLRHILARLLSVSVLTAGAVVAFSASPARAAECYDVALFNEANRRWVSAEIGYAGSDNGMLRARATAIGPYERFEICYLSTDNYNFSLRSLANNRWVSAELGYTGSRYAMLRARATSIGPWEKFSGYAEIQNSGNHRWVSAELGYSGSLNGMLRARAGTIGPWEDWTSRRL